jgi:thiamine biosynthesis lipoprotein
MMRRAQPWLGTLVDMTLEPDADPAAATAAFAEIARVQRLMSFHDADSDVSRFNRADVGDVIEVDRYTWNVLHLADQIAEASCGCFNVACAPLLVEWAYLPAPAAPPPICIPGMRSYELKADGRVRKSFAAWIDLGGIAKGYAVDLAIAALELHGVTSACVNAGGDLRVIGPSAWPVSIRAPGDPAAIAVRLELRNAALATSANYFSAKRLRGDIAVSPLVDGRDGRALTDATSVTVRAPTCAVADALTKVVMASGDATHPCISQFDASAFII